MNWRRKPFRVSAFQIEAGKRNLGEILCHCPDIIGALFIRGDTWELLTPNGMIDLRPGDWIVVEYGMNSTEWYCYKDEDFKRVFEEAM